MANNVYQQSFHQWYCNKFEWFVKQPMPFLIIYQAFLWLFYGFLWIPIWYVTSAKTIHAPSDEHFPPDGSAGTTGERPFAVGGGQLTRGTGARLTSTREQLAIEEQSPADAGSAFGLEDPVDINTADVDQLSTLPGFNGALAQKVVELRLKLGGFTSVDQLLERLKPKPHMVARLRESMKCSPPAGGRTVEF